ncbi:MAG: TonB-dependent receptor, partial [Acidobacteria bacterium]|nr:TonB-dependent receptor [Acidobacteriota bacterium]
VAKNRTFFFALFENDTRRPGPSTRDATDVSIPTPEGFGTLSRVPLASGQTMESRQAMLDALGFLREVYPRIKSYGRIASQNLNGTPIPVGTARVPIVNTSDNGFWRARFDHRLGSKDSLTFTTQGSLLSSPFSTLSSNLGFGALFAESQRLFNQKNTVSHTRTLTPRWVNEFRFGATWLRTHSGNQDDRPAVVISQAFTIGRDPGAPFDIVPEYNSYEWQNVSTLAAGRHFLKAGIDLNLVDRFENNQTDARGRWQFDNLASFLNNQAVSYTKVAGAQAFGARSVSQAYFAQDDFRATKELTLTAGLRYEYWNVPLGYFGATLPEVLAIGVPPPPRPDRNNWAPRLGLAFSPGQKDGVLRKVLGDGQTVFRGGYGIAYDFILDMFIGRNNYPRAVSATVNRPQTTNLFPNAPAAIAGALDPLANFVNVAPGAQLPATHFYSFSMQRQFQRGYVAELGYAGNRAYHLERGGQSNYAVLTPAQAQTVIAARNANAIASVQRRRLNPDWGSRANTQTNGNGHYNSAYVRVDKRFAHGLVFGGNYVWSCAMSDETSGVQTFASYRNENGRSLNDRPHRAVVHYAYELPWFRSARPLLKNVLGGWKLAGFSQWQAGAPFNVTVGVDATGDGSSTGDRPDYRAGGRIALDPVTGNFRTFRTPLDGSGIFVVPLDAGGRPLANSMPSGGNLGKQAFRGPGLSLMHLSVAKTFPVTEQLRVDFRADAENLLNHRNFFPPVSSMNNANFGNNTSDPGIRQVRLSVKLRF